MDDIEESVDGLFNQGDPSSNNVSSCGSLGQDEIVRCAEHLSDSTKDSANMVTSDVQDTSNHIPLSVQESSPNSLMDVSDHSVPCSRPENTPGSPIMALVPTTNLITTLPVQLSQEKYLLSETEDSSYENKVSSLSDSSSVGHLLMSYGYVSEEGISQEQEGGLSEDDSCDASYLQTLSYVVNTFNEQYQNKREDNKSSTTTESFSPEAFFSSIPLFKKLRRRRPAKILPKPNIKEYSSGGQYEHYLTSTHGVSAILPKGNPNGTTVIHDIGHGVPIAPRPADPNTKVSCYVLVVPTPDYQENFVPQETIHLQYEQEATSVIVPSEHEDNVTETVAIPDGTTPLQELRPMHPPNWSPRPLKQARTPLPSTRVRVLPSPHKGSSGQGSPVITVSTTTTPIQPLQGNTQQYVIVQGNHRHLKGLASYRDNFCMPTVGECHQPIYLQGLPPQGFRRLWKSRENTSTEKSTKRSLERLFCKASVPVNQEATVPEMEKSPLTCITDKVPCDREVPQHESSKSPERRLSTQETPDVSTSSPAMEEANDKCTAGVVDSECQPNDEEPWATGKETSDEVTIVPVSHGKCRENRERKKIRDRKYDADLKKAFEQLRRVVPRLPKNYSRGLILQETVKYIGNLEKKIQDWGLWPTLQAQDHSEQNAQSKDTSDETSAKVTNVTVTETEHFLSPTAFAVPDTCNNLTRTENDEAQTLLPEDDTGLYPKEDAPATLTSPIILSLSTEEGFCSFVSPEGAVLNVDCEYPDDGTVTLEEVPLSVPFQHVQLLSVDLNDDTPVLTPQSPEKSSSQELTSRPIPLIEVPGYTESGDYTEMSHGEDISSRQDLFVSVIDSVSTISHEELSDLGVTLSPLLSPLGILLSPGGDHSQDPTIAVLVDSTSSAIDGNMGESSAVVPGVCTDMTSIAASVEVTTDQRKKRTSPSVARKRGRPRLRTAQTVPSLSPLKPGDNTLSTPCGRNRRILQDNSNFEDLGSPVTGYRRGRRRKLKDGPSEQSFHGDENSTSAAKQTRTPPGRVSGVILSTKRETSSPRGGMDKNCFRRL